MRALSPALLIATAALLVVPAGCSAATAKPDLTVAAASRVKDASGGRVSGSLVVVNTGRAKAAASTARLSVVVPGYARRRVKDFKIPALRPGYRATVTVRLLGLPSFLAAGTYTLRLCADVRHTIGESDERDNCRTVGRVRAPGGSTGGSGATGGSSGGSTSTTVSGGSSSGGSGTGAGSSPPARPASTVPAHPIAYTTGGVTHLTDAQSDYYIYVPSAYDASHQTPTEMFIWMHGCGELASQDINTISTPSQGYITLSLGGEESGSGCFDPSTDQPKVFAAIADMEDHFNIDRRRIIIGGYSSGGDLAYRTAFYNAYTFAGVLGMNTSPFNQTGSTQQQSIAAAAWKFNVVQLAHTSDEYYNITTVRNEVAALQQAGFPARLIERPGPHHDANTFPDLQQYLLPYLNAGWTAP